MSVRIENDIAVIEGAAGVEDAEPLLAFLQGAPGRGVDIARATGLHTAVVQILIAAACPVRGESPDPFVRTWLMPLLAASSAEPGESGLQIVLPAHNRK